MKTIGVKCEREGTGFIAVADNGGEGVEHIECGQHHPAYKTATSSLIGNILAAAKKLSVLPKQTSFYLASESRPALAASSLSTTRLMGTRNLTLVKQQGETKVAQYGQWDGYPTGQGQTIADFLKTVDLPKFKTQVQTSIQKRTSRRPAQLLVLTPIANGYLGR